MKDYPIFEHLKQFSNMVDAQGNFVKTDDADGKQSKDETKKGVEE